MLAVTMTAVAVASPPGVVAQGTAADSGAVYATLERGRSLVETAPRVPALRIRVTMQLDGVTLEDALERITQKAGLGLTYRRRYPALSERISLHARDVSVVEALTTVLDGTGLRLLAWPSGNLVLVEAGHNSTGVRRQGAGTIIGRVMDATSGQGIPHASVIADATATTSADASGQFTLRGLALGAHAVTARSLGYRATTKKIAIAGTDSAAHLDFALDKGAQPLDQVVVTGTLVATQQRAVPSPITVITSDEIERKNMHDVGQLFRGDVPGAVAWDIGVSDGVQISVRGASSLTSAYDNIKTYVDGVELADPTFANLIDPAEIDRVEIIRGPQASTLYGEGALNGVMQIFTKRGRLGDRPHVELKLEGGTVETKWNPQHSAVTQHEEGLAITGGTQDYSYNVGGSHRYLGPWEPQYGLTNTSVYGGLHSTQKTFTADVTTRYFTQDEGTGDLSALIPIPAYANPKSTTGSRSLEASLATTFLPVGWWSTTATVGYESLSRVLQSTGPRLRSQSDTLLSKYESDVTKPQFTVTSAVTGPLTRTVQGTLTVGGNYTGLTEDYASFNGPHISGSLTGYQYGGSTKAYDGGYFSQGQLGISDAVFLTAGVRADVNPAFGQNIGTSLSPRVGVSVVRDLDVLTVKARASYGRAIRAPLATWRDADHSSPYLFQAANPDLKPEVQQGADGGVELYYGTTASAAVTYYDQIALNLIEFVPINAGAAPGAVPIYQFQNVGKVRNNGFELEGKINPVPAVSVSGTYSPTSSRAVTVGGSYTGDTRPGQQLLNHPRTAGGTTLSYTKPAGRVTIAMTYIGRYRATDNIALAEYYTGLQPYRGSQAAYDVEFPSVTKFQLWVQHRITSLATLFVQVDNLTNSYTTELFNTFPQKGRALTAGVRFRY